jgi:hypothetical protein
LISPAFFTGIRDGRFEYLLDKACGFTRREREYIEGITRGSTANGVGYLPCLARRRPNISSNRFCFHDRPCTLVKASSVEYKKARNSR